MKQITKTAYNKIHKDYRGIWELESKPEWIGKRSVMSGCIDLPIGFLAVEGVHFEIV